MTFGFFDLYWLYRTQGIPIVRSLRWAWHYANRPPDHTDSTRERLKWQRMLRDMEQP